MKSIYLIRHGQASFGARDYDRLSTLGTKQAIRLGDSWLTRPEPVNVYSGDMLRHIQTYDAFCAGYNNTKLPVSINSDFNEFDHVQVLQAFDPNFLKLKELPAKDKKIAAHNGDFVTFFSAAVNRWCSGEFEADYSETFASFQQRCLRGFNHIVDQGRAANDPPEDILVFTSGGCISVICAHLLELNTKQLFNINVQLKNTGVTRLRYTGNSIRLDYLNNYQHLENSDQPMVTSL